MIHILSSENSIVSNYLHELRDVQLQTNQRQFEHNIERLGVIAGYEASKLLAYQGLATTTPLGTATTPIIKDQIVLATVLRAGLPLQQGVKQIFDDAELCFIAAGRKPETAAGVEIELSYIATPRIDGKVLIIADTMIATGQSLIDAYEALTKDYGTPSRTIIVGVIASQTGVDFVTQNIPNVDVIVAAVDAELNDHFYIVPGLGDAGDLLYGQKAQPQL